MEPPVVGVGVGVDDESPQLVRPRINADTAASDTVPLNEILLLGSFFPMFFICFHNCSGRERYVQ
jgi:hypothetical protein